MSKDQKEVIREEIKATISKWGWWGGVAYKVTMLIAVALIYKGIVGVGDGALSIYDDWKQLKKDRLTDQAEHLTIDSFRLNHESRIVKIEERLISDEADIKTNSDEIVDIKLRSK